MEPDGMFLNVSFHRNEILVNEFRGLPIFKGLGFQPSTRASRRCSAEVEQNRLFLFLRLK